MDSPKRSGSPSSTAQGQQEIKRVKLTVPEQNQGVVPVDPENAPGKRSELEPIQSTDIANLPAEPANDAPPDSGSGNTEAKVKVQGEGDEDGGDVSGVRAVERVQSACATVGRGPRLVLHRDRLPVCRFPFFLSCVPRRARAGF